MEKSKEKTKESERVVRKTRKKNKKQMWWYKTDFKKLSEGKEGGERKRTERKKIVL